MLSLRFSSESKARNATKPGACSWFCAPRVSCVVQTVAIEIKHTAPRPCDLTGWHSWSNWIGPACSSIDTHLESSVLCRDLLGRQWQHQTKSNISNLSCCWKLRAEVQKRSKKGNCGDLACDLLELPLTMLRAGQGLITNDATLLRDVAQIDLNICTIRVGTCWNYVAVGGTCCNVTKTVWISQQLPLRCPESVKGFLFCEEARAKQTHLSTNGPNGQRALDFSK